MSINGFKVNGTIHKYNYPALDNVSITRADVSDEAFCDFADVYSSSKTYNVGDYAFYNKVLYRCITAITTAESWTADHWIATKLGNDVVDLKSALNESIPFEMCLGEWSPANNKLSLVYPHNYSRLVTASILHFLTSVNIRTDFSKYEIYYFSCEDAEGNNPQRHTWYRREFTIAAGTYCVLLIRQQTENVGVKLPDDVISDMLMKTEIAPDSVDYTQQIYKLQDYTKKQISSTNERNLSMVCRLGWNVYDANTPPEQSIASYKLAYKYGWKHMLCDIRMTSDGYFVCTHDRLINNLARQLNGDPIVNDIAIASITLAQADQYDWGIVKGNEYAGTKILRLQEFLRFCKLLNLTPHFEIKQVLSAADATRCVNLIKSYGLLEGAYFNDNEGTAFMSPFISLVPDSVHLGHAAPSITQEAINVAKSYEKHPFLYVTTDGLSSITEENAMLCAENGVEIGYTALNSATDVTSFITNNKCDYCKIVASQTYNLFSSIDDALGV